jgi:transposase
VPGDPAGVSIESLSAENAALSARNAELISEIQLLTRKVTELEKRLSKNSSNSSLPPSSDRFGLAKPENANRAARRAAGRKPGKQPGSEGNHLAQVENPDDVKLHSPPCCADCGESLADAPVEAVEVRQVFDLPEPKPLVTIEHRAETRRCRCGHKTKAPFPPEARGYTTYGPKLRAIALYLLAYQHLPFERCSDAIRDLFGVEVSTGFLDQLFTEGGDGLEPFLAAVLSHLKNSDVAHVDETFDKVGKNKAYIHVACNELYTLLHADVTRGIAGVERTGLFPDFTGVAVHDRLVQYFRYTKATHAVCGAHVMGDLASVAYNPTQHLWTSMMTALLYEMKKAVDAARAAERNKIDKALLSAFLVRYDTLIEAAFILNPDPPGDRKRNKIEAESYNLAVALRDHKKAVYRFATDLRVPFSNNIAERDLRMVKIHAKISGSFRSMTGAERFVAVRSYLSTARKHGLEPLAVLTQLFANEPWIPQRV